MQLASILYILIVNLWLNNAGHLDLCSTKHVA